MTHTTQRAPQVGLISVDEVTACIGATACAPDPSRAAAAIEAAALLLSLAIQDSRQPVEDLAGALQRMSQGAPAPEGITRELSVCIESLQFHDRLLQQLACARDLLTSALSQRSPDVAAYGANRWNAVVNAVRCADGADPESGLSALLSRVSSRKEQQGTCELF